MPESRVQVHVRETMHVDCPPPLFYCVSCNIEIIAVLLRKSGICLLESHVQLHYINEIVTQ